MTPSELRIAHMAAGGMTNREIAQALTVTAKTVETHLRHIYQKLDLTGRAQLPAALGEPQAAPQPQSRDMFLAHEAESGAHQHDR